MGINLSEKPLSDGFFPGSPIPSQAFIKVGCAEFLPKLKTR